MSSSVWFVAVLAIASMTGGMLALPTRYYPYKRVGAWIFLAMMGISLSAIEYAVYFVRHLN